MNIRVPGTGALVPGAASARPAERSERATWSLYLGLGGVGFGFLLMFAVLTPAAIVCGIGGLREIHARPELTGRARAWIGMGLAMVAPVLWVGLFVVFLVHGFT